MHLEKAHTAKNLQSGFYEVPHPQIPGEQDEYLQKNVCGSRSHSRQCALVAMKRCLQQFADIYASSVTKEGLPGFRWLSATMSKGILEKARTANPQY